MGLHVLVCSAFLHAHEMERFSSSWRAAFTVSVESINCRPDACISIFVLSILLHLDLMPLLQANLAA